MPDQTLEQTLADNLQRVKDTVPAIGNAIIAKGGTVGANDGLEEFAAAIATIPNSYTQADEGKVVSNGALVAQTAVTYTENGTYDTTTMNSVTVDVASSSGVTLGVGRAHTCIQMFNNTWTVKTWSGLTTFDGVRVWTDGENIYYSNGTEQYVLDKSTSTWSEKVWSGLTNFDGSKVWTDGENIYYSNRSSTPIQYVLDKSTSTWSKKVWRGLTYFYGSDVWTDGDNIYYSEGSIQYVLDKATSTWTTKTWNGYRYFTGRHIWTDGDNIYYSEGSNQYVLVKSPYITRSVPSAVPTKAITVT